MRKIFLALLILLANAVCAFGQTNQTVTLSTYYPAPYGAYDRLRLVPRATLNTVSCPLGTMYMNMGAAGQGDMLMLCQEDGDPDDDIGAWGLLPGVWTRIGNNIFPVNLLSGGTDDRFVRIGIGTTTPALKLHLENEAASGQAGGDAGMFSWTTCTMSASDKCGALLPGSATGGDKYDNGIKFIWYPRKGALRAGMTSSDAWSDKKIGINSVALGINPVADGYGATALGYTAQAHGNRSFALGFGAVTGSTTGGVPDEVGHDAVAISNGKAIGNGSIAIGIFGQLPGVPADIGQAQSNSFGSFVFGKWNVLSSNAEINRTSWVTTDPLFVIGNGSGTNPADCIRHNAFTILKDGRVGIGAASPRRLVDIETPVAAATRTPFLQLTNTPALDTTTTGRPSIDWFADYPTETDFTTARLSAEGGGNAAAPVPRFAISVSDTTRTLRDRLTINEFGWVGLGGIASARRLLEIGSWTAAATTTPILNLTNTNGDALTGRVSLDWFIDYSVAADFSAARIFVEAGGTTAIPNPRLTIQTADSTKTLRDRMIIDANGNVGIGTATPQANLEVSNTIRVTPRATQPPCNANTIGSIFYNNTPGDDNFYGCRYDGAAYGWAQLN
jgi:hypothetical protein